MTTQVRLSQLFAASGARTDLGAGWASGYGAEKPTFQGFNYLMHSVTSNILALAEGLLDWDSSVTYQAGAVVLRGGSHYTALKGNTNVDPTTDWGGSAQNWHKGFYTGGTGVFSPGTKMHKSVAQVVDNTVAGSSSSWSATSTALRGDNTSMYMERSSGDGVLLFSPTPGVFKLLEVTTATPDGRSLSSAYTFVTSNNFANYLPNSTVSAKGIVELATTTEARAGTDTTRAVTPAGLKASIDDIVIPTYSQATTSNTGFVELATTSEANAGSDTSRAITAAGLKSHVDAKFNSIPSSSTTVKGLVELATTAEANAGSDTSRAITAAGLKSHVDAKFGSIPNSSTSTKGLIETATSSETGAGSSTSLAATPAGVQNHYNQRVVIQTTTPSGVGSVPAGGMIIVVDA